MNGEGPGRAPSDNPHHEDAMRAIKESLGRIQYGSILITIHQGEVVGIETSTKLRLKHPK